jgi:N-methylhydantoinase A
VPAVTVASVILGVDVGGTFTDAVLVTADRLVTAKAPTTPDDQSQGVLAAVQAALERAGAQATEVEHFAHGMTVATNALLEGKGARTALLATRGFTDVVELGRQARADLYRLCARHPAPLVPRELRFPVPERTGPDGVLEALEPDTAATVCEAAAAANVEAIAVVLLHSYRHPQHEQLLGRALAEKLPDVHVSLSHETVGTFREFERAATTEVDAALAPLLRAYLRRLSERCAEAVLPAPVIMQSNGGLTDSARAAANAAVTVLSGPAGGAAGAALVAMRAGVGDVVGFDMGGTSCDVCVVEGGRPRETAQRRVAGRVVAVPMLDIHTVGAGGGSIAWRDAGGALRVGPQSAGAQPGPACYGRGGMEPTVTDANLVLGRLRGEGSPLAGGVDLDRDAAERAVATLGAELGLDPQACAEGIVRVADAEMVRALRVVTVERGLDPRGYALVACGGAGPMHAVAVAAELGMTRVVCPGPAGVLAALGLAASERRRDVQRSVLLEGESLTAGAIAAAVAELADAARAELGADGAELRVVYELRYAGQSFELPIEAGAEPLEPDELRSRLDAAHAERYGYADQEGTPELVTVRVTAATPGPQLPARWRAAAGASEPASTRPVVFAGEALEAAIWSGAPAPGAELVGPAVCELEEATVVVPPGWRGHGDDDGTIVLEGPAA